MHCSLQHATKYKLTLAWKKGNYYAQLMASSPGQPELLSECETALEFTVATGNGGIGHQNSEKYAIH